MITITIGPRTTRPELAGIVTRALRDALQSEPVLVGGAVVSIYTQGRYVSDDLDFVSYSSNKQIKPVMQELGFVQDGSHWRHPNTELLVQFINPPVMIGNKYVRKPDAMSTAAGNINILSPLDAACDRLSAYLHWDDMQALEQCADIMFEQRVSLQAVAEWTKGEDASPEKKRRALASLERLVARARPDAPSTRPKKKKR